MTAPVPRKIRSLLVVLFALFGTLNLGLGQALSLCMDLDCGETSVSTGGIEADDCCPSDTGETASGRSIQDERTAAIESCASCLQIPVQPDRMDFSDPGRTAQSAVAVAMLRPMAFLEKNLFETPIPYPLRSSPLAASVGASLQSVVLRL